MITDNWSSWHKPWTAENSLPKYFGFFRSPHGSLCTAAPWINHPWVLKYNLFIHLDNFHSYSCSITCAPSYLWDWADQRRTLLPWWSVENLPIFGSPPDHDCYDFNCDQLWFWYSLSTFELLMFYSFHAFDVDEVVLVIVWWSSSSTWL